MPWWGIAIGFVGFGVWTVVCVLIGVSLVQNQKTTAIKSVPNGRN